MAIAPNAERARTRYAQSLYRAALLREPDPARAARAVIAAFTSFDWTTAPLDDELEARLIARFPPLPRFRLRPRRGGVALPAAFGRLPPRMRLALGLRLLRGMSTPVIAQALGTTPVDAQGLLLDGLAAIGGYEPEAGPECRACRLAQLDEPGAGRAHVLACEACRTTLARWEQAASQLARELEQAVCSRVLPPGGERALQSALDRDDDAASARRRSSTLLWQAGLVCAVVVMLAALMRPASKRGSGASLGDPAAPSAPRQIVEQARAAYGAVPAGDGIVHRRWEIALEQPRLRLQAEEWVDPEAPGRHRMQLLEGQEVKEWQAADRDDRLRYHSTIAPQFCGQAPPRLRWNTGEISMWALPAGERAAMREARWQHGPWAVGRHYLDLAAGADSLRSLGSAGRADAATLTLAAEGRAISGTLFLRFDRATLALQEVREVRTEDGQTIDRTPWRLIASETLDPGEVYTGGLLTVFPAAARPRILQRQGSIVDRACPLLGTEQAASLPRILAMWREHAVVGLASVPAGIERAMVIAAEDWTAEALRVELSPLEVIYVGPGKRLAFLPGALTRSPAGGISVDPWRAEITPYGAGELVADVWAPAPGPLRGDARGTRSSGFDRAGAAADTFRVWATGWTEQELIDLLKTVRHLRLDDWARTPDLFYEPEPFDAATLARLSRIFQANAPREGATLHQVLRTTFRQPPVLEALADPYHMPPLHPPMQRTEIWSEVRPSGRPHRWRWILEGPQSELLSAGWSDGSTQAAYDGRRNTLVREPATSSSWRRDYATRELIFFPFTRDLLRFPDWTWQTLRDGTMIAERAEAPEQQATAPGIDSETGLGYWSRDLGEGPRKVRLVLGADGTLQRREILAPADGSSRGSDAPAATVGQPAAEPDGARVLESVVVETREWLPSVPETTFAFRHPEDALVVDGSRQEVEPEARTLHSPSYVAAEAPYKLWGWREGAGPGFDHAHAAATSSPDAQQVRGATIDQALNIGAAIELWYRTPSGPLLLTQGPAVALRQILRQTEPRWRTSALRTIMIAGQPREVWLMHDQYGREQWAVVELDETLLFFHHEGAAAGFERIVEQLAQLQEIVSLRP